MMHLLRLPPCGSFLGGFALPHVEQKHPRVTWRDTQIDIVRIEQQRKKMTVGHLNNGREPGRAS